MNFNLMLCLLVLLLSILHAIKLAHRHVHAHAYAGATKLRTTVLNAKYAKVFQTNLAERQGLTDMTLYWTVGRTAA
jgi:hypothetical protein